MKQVQTKRKLLIVGIVCGLAGIAVTLTLNSKVSAQVSPASHPDVLRDHKPVILKVINGHLDHIQPRVIEDGRDPEYLERWLESAYSFSTMHDRDMIQGPPGTLGCIDAGCVKKVFTEQEVLSHRKWLDGIVNQLLEVTIHQCSLHYSWDSSCLDIEFGVNFRNWLKEDKGKISIGEYGYIGANRYSSKSVREVYNDVLLWEMMNLNGVI